MSVGLQVKVEPRSPGAGIPTGEVIFEMVKKTTKKTMTTTLGTATLSRGDATLAMSAKRVLNTTIEVVYGGDTDFKSSNITPPVLR